MINKYFLIRRRITFAILFMIATLSIQLFAQIKLRTDKDGALYQPGEIVRFTAVNQISPESDSTIKGKVFDSSNSLVYEKTIPFSEFIKNGWQWLPQKKAILKSNSP